MMIAAAGCGDDSVASEPAGEAFRADFDCGGLADRWVEIYQAYLDDLGDMSEADLDIPIPAAGAASRRLAMSLTEQARDAAALGCAAELTSGSAALCTRVERLSASGPAGESIIEQLQGNCPSSSGG